MFIGNTVMNKLYSSVSSQNITNNNVLHDLTDSGQESTSLKKETKSFNSISSVSEHQYIEYENDVYRVVFSNAGAIVTSLQLKKFIDNVTNESVEMVLHFEEDPSGAFVTYLSVDNILEPIFEYFEVLEKSADRIVFALDIEDSFALAEESQKIRLLKTFEFKQDEYLFKVNTTFVSLDGLPLSQRVLEKGYTLEGLPQIGPAFTRMDGRDVYRHAIYLNFDKKRSIVKLRNGEASAPSDARWAGIAGKYFLIIGVPDIKKYNIGWTTKPLSKDVPDGMQLNFSKISQTERTSMYSDDVFYYVGPKQENELLRYNLEKDNSWGLDGLFLNRSMDVHIFLGLFITPLKAILSFIHYFVGNWGWSIVILTFMVKLILLPSSISSAVSMAAMSKIQPKLRALQEKYKDSREELARKQMELYQQEGVNPAGGCLPILIQLPILFALFSLFNQYFELRGASWIFWINDLSSPDQLLTFTRSLPILGWTHLNLLPIFYVITQMLTTLVTSTDSMSTNSQMKLMMWFLPLIFFFMLYNMPSGLFLYWTVSNILGLFQQILINSWKKSGKLDKMHAAKEAKQKIKNTKRKQMMAAYQQRLNQSKGKHR